MTDDRESITDVHELKPDSETLAAPERDTQPPSAPVAAPLLEIPPAARPARISQPDPLSFTEQAMQAILDGMAELKTARKAFDADKLLSKQTEVFSKITTDRYDMVREAILSKMQELGDKFDELAKRVERTEIRIDKTEDRLDDGAERFESMSLELAAMRAQLAGYDQLAARMDRLEQELAKLREGQQHAATTEAAPAAKLDTPASDP